MIARVALAKPSSLVKSVGYDPDFQILEVELHTAPGAVYRFQNVGKSQHEALIDPANSAGRVFNDLKRQPGVTCERFDADVLDEMAETAWQNERAEREFEADPAGGYVFQTDAF